MRLTIRKKLMFGYIAVLVFMVAVSILAYLSLNNISTAVTNILVHSHKYDMVDGLKHSLKQFLDVNDSLLKGQIQDIEYYQSLANDVEKKILYVGKLRLKEDEKGLLGKVQGEFSFTRERALELVHMDDEERGVHLAILMREMDRSKPVLINSIDALYDEAWRSLDNVTMRADRERERGIQQIIIFSIMAIGMGLGISIYFSRKITNPLKALSKAASSVAEGDLDQTVEEAEGDEVGELITAFNRMVHDLKTSRDQVEKYNRELQAMVEERTTELEKTKEYLENILEYSGDMIITTTLFDEIVQFNSGAETLLGYKKERMVGINIDTLFANKSDYRKLREKVVAGDDVSSYETKLMQKSGDIIDVSLTFSQLRDRSGEIIGLVGIGRNITEKKKLEDEQKKYADRLLKEIEESAKAAQTSEKRDNNSDENR